MSLFHTLLSFLRTLFTPRLKLAAENLALRQQLVILNRTAKQPKLQPQDRLFWNLLYRLWKDWRSALLIVSKQSYVYLGSTSPNPQWQNIESRSPRLPRRTGKLSSAIMPSSLPPSTFSPSRPPRFVTYTVSSCSRTTAGRYCTSTSLPTRQLLGRRSRL